MSPLTLPRESSTLEAVGSNHLEAPKMDKSTVYVRFSRPNNQWVVCGANLPTPGCWSLHDSEGEARAAAEELAADFGVGVEMTGGSVVFL